VDVEHVRSVLNLSPERNPDLGEVIRLLRGKRDKAEKSETASIDGALIPCMQERYESDLLVDAAPNVIPPSQYDVLLTDICEEHLKYVCSELGQEYLSVRENKAEFPLSGLLYGSNHRLFVCLPVEKRNIELNVPFLIDTGAPYTYVTQAVFEKLKNQLPRHHACE